MGGMFYGLGMPDAPEAPEPPPPPPPKAPPITKVDEEVQVAARDTRKEQLKNYSRKSTLLAGELGGSNAANVGNNSSLLGG